MAQTNFNVGTSPNDGTGEPLRQAFQEQQAMNTELYTTKVDKVTGKGLSAEDFTNDLKVKLSGIAPGAEVNVQADWNQADNTQDDFIKNKPDLGNSQEYKTASFTAENGVFYTVKGSGIITITDPVNFTGQGYIVYVLSGFDVVIGPDTFIIGCLIYRFYNGSAWVSKDIANIYENIYLYSTVATKLTKTGDTLTGDIGNSATGFFRVPSGTTAQRPSSPLNGMERYNTDTLRNEFYSNGVWLNHARLSGDTFTGAVTVPSLNVVGGKGTMSGSTATSGTDVLLELAQTWNTASTPTGIRLSVTETITASNGAMLLDFKVNGVTVFSVSKQGNVVIAGTLALSNQILQSVWESSGSNAPSRLRFKGTNATGTTPRGLIVENAGNSNNINHSTGTFDLISTDTGFAPTSGTGSFTFLLFSSIINQTGGANGIIRGFFVNPTLTSLIGEFRALDIQSGKLVFSSTIIAPGTTGAQTINKISGKVNAASGTTSLVVTNNLVTASSIVMCQMGTNDSTCRITSVVEAAGSFTINYIAPTAETVIKFKVIN